MNFHSVSSVKTGLMVLFISILACSEPSSNTKNNIQDSDSSKTNEFLGDSVLVQLDTTLPDGRNVKFIWNRFESPEIFQAQINTGNWDTIFNINQELAKDHSSLNPFNQHSIYWSGSSFIGIRSSCGSPCHYDVVIPTIPGQRPRGISFPYTDSDPGVEMEDNYISYLSDYRSKTGMPRIIVENLENGNRDSIDIDDSWKPKVSYYEMVDTLFVGAGEVLIGQLQNGKLVKQMRMVLE
ncbi:hypothetical protein GYB22_01470 [bacterium]|nr:hypothetical protein [bacterium]